MPTARDPERRVVRAPRGAALVATLVLALAAIGTAAALSGPVQVGDSSVLTRIGAPPAATDVPPEPAGPLVTVDAGRADDEVPGDDPLPLVLGWLTGVAAAALLVLAARRLGREADLVATAPPPPVRRDGPGAAEPGLADRLARAADDAARLLSRPSGEARDGVVACWLALEEAATRAGTAPRPTQTATEFTVVVLERHRADPDAVRTLLRAYHRARFGSATVTEQDVATARSAVETIGSSLSSTRTTQGAR